MGAAGEESDAGAAMGGEAGEAEEAGRSAGGARGERGAHGGGGDGAPGEGGGGGARGRGGGADEHGGRRENGAQRRAAAKSVVAARMQRQSSARGASSPLGSPHGSRLQVYHHDASSRIVKLNVGGQRYTTTSTTLLQAGDSFFSALLRGARRGVVRGAGH